MTREELIKNDGYWQASIENALYHKNYKGKNRRAEFISDILKMKNELINSLSGNTVKPVKSCVNCRFGNVDRYKEPCGSCDTNYSNWQLE